MVRWHEYVLASLLVSACLTPLADLFVHFLMYSYYAATSLQMFSWLRRTGFLLTILQTLQMIVGLAVILTSLFSCQFAWQRNWHGLLFALGMYSVYFWLFFKLIFEKFRVAFANHQNQGKKKKNKSKKQK